MRRFEVAVQKESPETHFGITLSQKTGSSQIVINNIVASGPFAKTELIVGLQVVEINFVGLSDKSVADAVNLLKEAPVGEISMVACGHVATAYKKTKATKVGISIQKSRRDMIIQNIAEDSLFANSGLKAGQRISSINGKDCPSKSDKAIQIIRESVGALTIVALVSMVNPDNSLEEDKPSSEEKVIVLDDHIPEFHNSTESTSNSCSTNGKVTASITRSHSGEKLGLALRNSKPDELGNQSKRVIINRIDKSGLVARCNAPLVIGQTVESINGVPCPKSAKKATEMISDSTIVTIIASSTVATVIKSDVSTKIGITLGLSSFRKEIIIKYIDPDGLFGNSRLCIGQRLTYINGETPGSVRNAIKLIKSIVGEVTIMAVDRAFESKPNVMALEQNQRVILPGHVTFRVIKERKDQLIGLRVIRSFQHRIVISAVRETGLFGSSDLRIGQYIVSINGKPCPSSKEETTRLIMSIVGPLEIVAADSVGIAEKPAEDTKVGISLGLRNGYMAIVELSPMGLLKSPTSNLREAQRVVTINGQRCPDKLHDAITLIRKCVGKLTIVAVDAFKIRDSDNAIITSASTQVPSSPKNETIFFRNISATISGKQSDDTLGLYLRETQHNIFVIKIAYDSPFAKTDLCVGHRIEKINGEVVSGSSLGDVLDLIAQHVGEMTIDAVEILISPDQASSSLIKKSPSAPLEISVRKSKQGRISIYDIPASSQFLCSPLKIGQVVLSINGNICRDHERMTQLFHAASGKVTIVASATVVYITKPNIDSKAGLCLGQHDDELGTIVAHKIDPNGLLRKSNILPGQRIVSIAGVECPTNLKEAVGLIRDCVGKLKIVAADTFEMKTKTGVNNDTGLVIAFTVKETVDSKIGIRLRRGQQPGKIVISKINDDSPLSHSGLMLGQTIVSINGKLCPSDPKEATALIKQLPQGEITIVAKFIVVYVTKKSESAKLGISLGTADHSNIVVRSITAGSLFAKTALKVGHRVVFINDYKCNKHLNEANKVIHGCVGYLKIVAVERIAAKEAKDIH
jgi:C-terminal processing protease CtpA/Prc